VYFYAGFYEEDEDYAMKLAEKQRLNKVLSKFKKMFIDGELHFYYLNINGFAIWYDVAKKTFHIMPRLDQPFSIDAIEMIIRDLEKVKK
jgi:hypothetical protein